MVSCYKLPSKFELKNQLVSGGEKRELSLEGRLH